MSEDRKKGRILGEAKSWDYLKEVPSQPEGPQKPWGSELDRAAEEFVDFLQNSESKKAVKDFIIESYKKFENEKIDRLKDRVEQEQKVNQRGASGSYQAGNIEPILHDTLNMTEVEQAFAHGLKGTKNRLIRSLDDRVEEINRLLADIGGFSSQLKSSFARSTVVFLEQEDPKFAFRERLIFSINLPNYELKRSWDPSATNQKGKSKRADGRTSLQATWDEAVNVLARIVETTGLKPKYCKNDRHYGRFVMKQDLRSRTNMPDEYFSFILDYNSDEKIQEMSKIYNQLLSEYESKINRLSKKIRGFSEDSKSNRYHQLKKKHLYLNQERDFFVGSTPDPNQLDEGLLFQIEVSTLKDYHIVKDRMQSIMTRYILHLSKIAANDASLDKELEYQLSKNEQFELVEDEKVTSLEGVQEYSVDVGNLQQVESPLVESKATNKKKKAA